MSNARFCIIPARALGDKRLSHADVMTLNALGLHGDKDGWCFPSHAEIAKLVGSHIQTVRKATRHLAECGYVETRARARSDGSQTSNEYRVLFDHPGEQLSLDVKNQTASDQEKLPPDSGPTPPEPNGSPPCADSLRVLSQATLRVLSPATLSLNRDILTPHLTPHKINIPGKAAQRKIYPAEFELLWMAWPEHRRCEKPHAHTAWLNALKLVTPDELLAAVREYVRTDEAATGYAPYPAKWLKGERWQETACFSPSNAVRKPEVNIAALGNDTPENRGLLSIFEKLRSIHGQAVFNSWLAPLRIANKNCTVLQLSAPNRFMAEWIRTHYAGDIGECVRQIWPEIGTVVIDVR